MLLAPLTQEASGFGLKTRYLEFWQVSFFLVELDENQFERQTTILPH
jgi:hypothetical protein